MILCIINRLNRTISTTFNQPQSEKDEKSKRRTNRTREVGNLRTNLFLINFNLIKLDIVL